MKVIELTNILSEKDFDNNYVLLFDKNDKFIGSVIYVSDDILGSSVYVKDDKGIEDHDSISEFIHSYRGYVIKLVPLTEMRDIFEASPNCPFRGF